MAHATCAICGVQYQQRRPTQKYCSEPCKNRRPRAPRSEAAKERDRKRIRPARVCSTCQQTYHPTCGDQKHCSRKCGGQMRKRCWPSTTIRYYQCATCGQTKVTQRPRTYCSDACAQTGHGRIGDAVTLPCKRCGQGFTWVVAWSGRPDYCTTCRAQLKREARRKLNRKHRSRRKHRQRARHYGVAYEAIDRQYVFQRDRWRCQLCGKQVARTKQAPHPRSPTIDCTIPLSTPGSPGYVLSNVHLACFLCNSTKGNRGGAEQLRLFG